MAVIVPNNVMQGIVNILNTLQYQSVAPIMDAIKSLPVTPDEAESRQPVNTKKTKKEETANAKVE